jgi:glycine dehydrogenase subunit 2
LKLIFERKGKNTGHVQEVEVSLGEPFTRSELPLPELNEVDVVRHYTALSKINYGVDSGFYPLGSCTMKYSPKINEDVSRLEGFSELHPLSPENNAQGALQLMYELERDLCEITGMDTFSFQPAAGAHGELTGVMIAKAYFKGKRKKIIIPDSAHGTNPASAAVCGFEVVNLPSDSIGGVDVGKLKEIMNKDVALLMLTNPNTLGLFDENILEISKIVHDAGGLTYYDGANLNAMLGITRPGDQGFDIVHLNLHKTFSTPHGGGGPGSGPVGVKAFLEKYLPLPRVVKKGNRYRLLYKRKGSIGRVKTFFGNFGVLVKAYAYIKAVGPDLKKVAEVSVLNANYLMHSLKDVYKLPYDRICAHEFVLSAEKQMQRGVTALDIAKRILDYGFHAPTIYFPLIVKEALMIEPTETESKENLDRFIEIMKAIADEPPEVVRKAPTSTPVSRLDGVLAARKPNLRWRKE